jgi:asparagine N-glycosylation enzyme membrane subunit Stt3
VKRAFKAFVDFWMDFLIGDAPEFFFVTLAVVALAFLLHTQRTVGVIVLPLVTLLAISISASRVRRR